MKTRVRMMIITMIMMIAVILTVMTILAQMIRKGITAIWLCASRKVEFIFRHFRGRNYASGGIGANEIVVKLPR